MAKIDKQIEEIQKRSESEYMTYKEQVGKALKEFEDKRDRYNAQMNLVNTERFYLRDEINALYQFLLSIGGALERKISVFEYKTESFAPNTDWSEIPPVAKPDFKEEHVFFDPIIKTVVNHSKNKEMLLDYENSVNAKKLEYDRDIEKRETDGKYMEDAIEIAEIYRNIVAIVRDTIKNKIIPEFEFIQAFLYADSIREIVLENGTLSDIEPCSIAEYKGTEQDIHYQFVKNTFDFYDVCTTFFKNTVLTDILEDRVVSKEEKDTFHKNIESIKSHINLLESKKVVM